MTFLSRLIQVSHFEITSINIGFKKIYSSKTKSEIAFSYFLASYQITFFD